MKRGFEKRHEVCVHDPKLGTSISTVTESSEIAYIAVPTPTSETTGKCDTSIVEEILDELPNAFKAVIKSTIAPGTMESFAKRFPHLRLAHCPEFLRENSANEDFLSQDILVVGSHDKELAEEIFRHHRISNLVSGEVFFHVTPTEAELVKYAKNSFYAMKLIFANQFYDYCQELGGEWSVVREIITHPQKQPIGPSHLEAIYGEKRGFGGKCIPKDVRALNQELKERGIAYNLFDSIQIDNEKLRDI